MVNGKQKGATAERELADLLTYWGTLTSVKLKLERNLEQSRNGGHDLNGLEQYGLAVECKRVEVLDVKNWWAQAVRQALAVNCLPVLAYRQNRKDWTFKVRILAALQVGERWDTVYMDVTMDAPTFKAWFIKRLALYGG